MMGCNGAKAARISSPIGAKAWRMPARIPWKKGADRVPVAIDQGGRSYHGRPDGDHGQCDSPCDRAANGDNGAPHCGERRPEA